MADSTKKKKNYVKGSAKTKVFSNGGEIIHLDIKMEGKIYTKDGFITPNEAGYVKIDLSKLSEPDQYGNSHAIFENDFKPEKTAPKAKASSPTPAKAKVKTTSDDLPF